MSLCASAAPPTQLLSRERAGPSNSERKSEQEAVILLRAGEREEWVKRQSGVVVGGQALISDESNSVNCC